MWRLVLDPKGTLYKAMGLPGILVTYLMRVSRSRSSVQGIGKHTKDELREMMQDDLSAIEELLGIWT